MYNLLFFKLDFKIRVFMGVRERKINLGGIHRENVIGFQIADSLYLLGPRCIVVLNLRLIFTFFFGLVEHFFKQIVGFSNMLSSCLFLIINVWCPPLLSWNKICCIFSTITCFRIILICMIHFLEFVVSVLPSICLKRSRKERKERCCGI